MRKTGAEILCYRTKMFTWFAFWVLRLWGKYLSTFPM